ncbi:hypothetical protein [Chamaesiphon sp.]|uniref:hypothetical protein n=1 Tax=Chamaesiphon sp. TaxID=2814140 RepID=UPI00359314F8
MLEHKSPTVRTIGNDRLTYSYYTKLCAIWRGVRCSHLAMIFAGIGGWDLSAAVVKIQLVPSHQGK